MSSPARGGAPVRTLGRRGCPVSPPCHGFAKAKPESKDLAPGARTVYPGPAIHPARRRRDPSSASPPQDDSLRLPPPAARRRGASRSARCLRLRTVGAPYALAFDRWPACPPLQGEVPQCAHWGGGVVPFPRPVMASRRRSRSRRISPPAQGRFIRVLPFILPGAVGILRRLRLLRMTV